MEAWWSEATDLEFASQNGGAYSGGPFRGVIHTTELMDFKPSKRNYFGKFDPPHFTLVMEKGSPGSTSTSHHGRRPLLENPPAASRPTGARPSRSNWSGRPRKSTSCPRPWSSGCGIGCVGSRPGRRQRLKLRRVQGIEAKGLTARRA